MFIFIHILNDNWILVNVFIVNKYIDININKCVFYIQFNNFMIANGNILMHDNTYIPIWKLISTNVIIYNLMIGKDIFSLYHFELHRPITS